MSIDAYIQISNLVLSDSFHVQMLKILPYARGCIAIVDLPSDYSSDDISKCLKKTE
jgi:hypothetical protein